MDINKILSSLGLDLSNPEVKRGAIEAISAIIDSRQPMSDMGGLGQMNGGDQEVDIEVDPDLLQPSSKSSASTEDDIDIEVNDEEDLLGQVKENETDESEQDKEDSSKGMSQSQDQEDDDEDNSSDSDSEDDSEDSSETNGTDTQEKTSAKKQNSDKEDKTDTTDTTDEDPEEANSVEDDVPDMDIEDEVDDNDAEDDTSDDSDNTDGLQDDESEEDSEVESSEDGVAFDEDEEDGESGFDDDDFEEADEDTNGDPSNSTEAGTSEGDEDANEESEEDEWDFDEDEEYFDDEEDSFKDVEVKKKEEARRIKRERTIEAGKKALADAKARKAAPALIRELEKAIEDLESLTEAIKSLKDLSDTEFNLKINRILDAIDALGDKSLTFSSDEERQTKAQEIKADLAKQETQNELSAEDIAKIRDEHQATAAREKELDKYRKKSASSFKGFQEFLQSLYRAVALQVSTEETRDDSWSAISRRNSGAGVLRQGKKINELSNRKIPVIDFYFDQSVSWNSTDIQIGEKAVAALADMEAEGKIKINIYYFGDKVSNTNSRSEIGSGTSGWNEIVKNVIATNATNVIIMTDDDMEDWWEPQNKPALTYTVPGYVWYLWKRGSNAPRLPRDLKGRGGVQQFSFTSADL